MTRFRLFAFCALVMAFALGGAVSPAQANVSRLVLHSRTCGTIDAFVVYDSFSEGIAPFYAVFSVDTNGNGIFGEVGEATKYITLTPTGQAQSVSTILRFNPVPEGSLIAVTAYEIDSNGTRVSDQLSPVAYYCTHKPAKNPLPPDTDLAVPAVAVVAKIKVAAVTVYSNATTLSSPLGGLGLGATVNVVARNARGDFLQIEYKGQLGWFMWQTRAILFGPYADLPVLPNAESSTNIFAN